MSKFEDSLWADMQREHGQALLRNMAKHRSRRTTRWIGAAAAVVVLGTGGLVASTYFGGAPPAYAVVDNPDGSVTLRVWDLNHFEEATAKLRDHGVPAAVLPVQADCQSVGRLLDVTKWQVAEQGDFRADEKGFAVTIVRDRIPPGATLVLGMDKADAATTGTVRPVSQIVRLYERDHTPSCLRPGN